MQVQPPLILLMVLVPVETIGSVDVSLAGAYVLTYKATDNAGNSATKDRTVTVTDTINPVITGGDAELTAELAPAGTIFDDPGALATDGGDGDLASNVICDRDPVDLATVGTYTLTYSVTDTAGNESYGCYKNSNRYPRCNNPINHYRWGFNHS